MLKSKFDMLRNVEDGALVRVTIAQIMRSFPNYKPGEIQAQKVEDRGVVTELVHYKVSETGKATGCVFTVESDCLVEVLLEDAA